MELKQTPLSRLSRLVEVAAIRAMRPALGDGESSISLTLDITHLTQSPTTGDLRAVATCEGVNGRVHRFLVHVFDATGLVASAEHARVVVPERGVVGLPRRGAETLAAPR
jgi:fluoroacetyl-CoA thioesterase